MFHYCRQIAVSLGVVLMVMVFTAGGFGQNQPMVYAVDSYVDNQVTVNQCSTGEPIALSGSMHFNYSFTTDSNGVNHFSIAAANNLMGIGQNSGTTYSASDSNPYSADTSQPSAELTVDFKTDLNSQGQAPTLTLIQTLHILVDTTGNIVGATVQNMTQCGTGS
jgi:hypothetical protein